MPERDFVPPRGLLKAPWGWLLSLFLTGLAAKLWLIQKCGTPLPFLDQWDGEAAHVYLPYFAGRLSLADLFRPHNEHRIFFTRIYDLALLLLNGQWDNQLEMVANAVVHSAAIAALGGLLARLLEPRHWPLIWPPLALALVLPFAWENTLAGFQIHFYFLLIFSGLTIWLLDLSPPWSVRWWLGVAAGTAALFTNASGSLAVGAVFALTALEAAPRRNRWRQHWPTLLACVLIGLADLRLKGHIRLDHSFQVHSAGAFLTALGRNLAWPWIVLPGYAPFNLLPLLMLGWVCFHSAEEPPAAEKLVLGLGLWAVLQSLAAAYARGGTGAALPSWKYMDSSSLLMVANWLGIVLLLARHRERLKFIRYWKIAFAVWTLACLTGLVLLTGRVWSIDIPEQMACQRSYLATTRAFMATDDLRVLQQKSPTELAFPVPETLAELLRNPQVRRILPACVREPLRVVAHENGDRTFRAGGWPEAVKTNAPMGAGWGSWPENGAKVPGGFESLPVPKSTLPFLEFPVVGGLAEPGASLQLIDAADGRVTPIRPPRSTETEWLNVDVPAPAGEFKILARDESAAQWFAFKEPRELGRLSFWAARLLAAWPYILAAGLGFLVLSCLALKPGGNDDACKL